MSKTIDEKVVSMQFDNKQFESNVQTSLSTLEKLKQGLNLTGASKGLESVNTAAKNFDISPLSNGVESVKVKFSALEVVAMTALSNITNSAISAGKNLVSALTGIDAIKSGFQEYETQINAVQTILANTESKGTTIDDVNKALDELNTYADKTIYNFTEMTRNIGTFTAAGVDLDTSVSAIQGIANLAAVSGSTSTQASTAMYQLSQALATGTVKLQDWNSVVNAGMGGEVFQNALKDTAREMGTDVDAIIEQYGTFRESLTYGGWLTSDVLTTTLSKMTKSGAVEYLADFYGISTDSIQSLQNLGDSSGYTSDEFEKMALKVANGDESIAETITDTLSLATTAEDAATKVKTFSQLMDTLKEAAQSGWTQSWEIIIGDFEEAKELWTDVSDYFSEAINNMSEARNSLLSGALESGWDQLLGAGISDEEGFIKTLKKVAKENDVAFGKMIKNADSFEEALSTALSDGSITSDMLTESVTRLYKSVKNMSAEELEAAGYTLEQVSALKELKKGLKDGSISMDEFVEKMTRPSGRELMIESVRNAFTGLMSVITPIKEAFREIFPATTSEQLYSILENLQKFTSTLKLTDKQSENLKATFKGLFSVLDIVLTVIKQIANGAFQLIGYFTGLGDGILNITGSIGDYVSGLRDSLKESDLLGDTISKITEILGNAIDKIKEFGSSISQSLKLAPGYNTSTNILNIISDTLSTIWDVCKKVGSKIAEVINDIGDAFLGMLRSGDVNSFLDVFNVVAMTGVLNSIKKFMDGINKIFEKTDDTKSKIPLLDNIKDTLSSVQESLQSWQQNLKAGTLLKLASAIAILAISLTVLAAVDPERLNSALKGITVLFAELVAAVAAFEQIGSFKGTSGLSFFLLSMATSVLILASALKKVSGIDTDSLASGVIAIGFLITFMTAAAKVMSSGSGQMMKGASGLIMVAVAIKILASALRDLSDLNLEQIANGLIGIGGLLAELAVFTKLTQGSTNMISVGAGMLILSAALKVLASVCADFAAMDMNSINQGLASVGILLGEMAAFTMLTKGSKNMMSIGVGMVLLAASLKILASVVEDISALSITELEKGLGGLAIVLAEVTAAVNLMPKNMVSIGIGLTIVSAALLILSDVLSKFGGMSPEEIGKGLASLGGALTELTIALNLMSGTLGGSAALLVAAIALGVLAPIIKGLSTMSWEGIAKGLITLAGSLAIIGVAGVLLAPLASVLLTASAAIALFGIGCLAAGVGILALATGLTALAAAGTAGATSLVASLSILINGILGLIPQIAESLVTLITSVIDGLVAVIPTLADGLMQIISGVLSSLAQYAPQIVDSLLQFLIGVINSLADNLPTLIDAFANLFSALFQGVADAIGNIDMDTFMTGVGAVGIMTVLMTALSGVAALIPSAMTGLAGIGLILAELSFILAGLGALSQIPGLSWFIDEGGELLESIGTAIGKFVGGLIGGIAEGASSTLPAVGTNLSNFMTNLGPFIEGAKSLDATMLDNVKTLSEALLVITGASLLEAITSWVTGSSSMETFATQLQSFGDAIVGFSQTVSGNVDEGAVTAAVNAGSIASTLYENLPKEGGLSQAIFGGTMSLETFGEQLTSFGDAIVGFSQTVSGNVSEEAVTAAVNAGTLIAGLYDALPEETGWIDKLFGGGTMTLDDFGTQLSSFGDAIVKFSDTVTGNIDTEAVTTAVTSVQAIVDIATVLSDLENISNLGTFTSGITSMGTSLVSFSNSVIGIDNEAISNAVSSVRKIAGVTSYIVTIDSSQTSTFKTAVDNLAASLNKIANTEVGNIDSFISAVKKVASVDVDASSLSSTAESVSSSVSSMMSTVSSSISSSKSSVDSSMSTALSGMASTISGKSSDVSTAATSLVSAVSKALSNGKNSVTAAAGTMVSGSATKIRSYYSSFYSAGQNIVNGLIAGINSKRSAAIAAGNSLGKATANATKSGAQVNSPSKISTETGVWIGEGLILGISQMSKSVVKAGNNIGETAAKSVSGAISTVANLLSSDLDVNPTITPVLDLSNVSSGIGTLNGMISGSSVRVLSDIGSIGTSIDRIQNGSNSDVVSAIKDLKGSLGNSSGDTYQINGVTYDDGSNITDAVQSIVRAARIERRS